VVDEPNAPIKVIFMSTIMALSRLSAWVLANPTVIEPLAILWNEKGICGPNVTACSFCTVATVESQVNLNCSPATGSMLVAVIRIVISSPGSAMTVVWPVAASVIRRITGGVSCRGTPAEIDEGTLDNRITTAMAAVIDLIRSHSIKRTTPQKVLYIRHSRRWLPQL
jgi:hypothetical protein